MILGPSESCEVDIHHRRRLTWKGPVLSIEDLPDLNSSVARYKYWIVPFEDVKPFITGGPWLFQVLFTVIVKKID